MVEGSVRAAKGGTCNAHGRLNRVQEPARSDGGIVTTSYEDDVGSRLKKVRQDSGRPGPANRLQLRTFVYDSRSFLLEETHLEQGGPVRYGDYSALFMRLGTRSPPSWLEGLVQRALLRR